MFVSKTTAVVAWSGGTMVLKTGRTIDEAHPLLKERPDLFEEQRAEEQKPDIETPQVPVVQTTMNQGAAGGRVRKVTGQ